MNAHIELWQAKLTQVAWQDHTFQALVEPAAEGQSLQAAWQGHTSQALVEKVTKGQSLQAAWQGDTF